MTMIDRYFDRHSILSKKLSKETELEQAKHLCLSSSEMLPNVTYFYDFRPQGKLFFFFLNKQDDSHMYYKS